MNNNSSYSPNGMQFGHSNTADLSDTFLCTKPDAVLLVKRNGPGMPLSDEAFPYPSSVLEEPDPAEQAGDNAADQSVNDFEPSGYRFLHLVKSDPFRCLTQVFDNFTLQELSEIWRSWTYCAVCTEYSAFSEETDRKYLLAYADIFAKVIESEHYALVKWMKGKKLAKPFSLDKKYVRYRQLDQKDSAYKHIRNFAVQYPEKRVKRYLWGMLECVLTDGGNFGITRKNLLFDYEAFLSVGRASFYLLKHYPKLFDTGKK